MDIRLRCPDKNNLGNGLEEIKFFSKDVNYDRLQYESCVLSKDNTKEEHRKTLLSNNKLGFKDPLKVWEEGGPVKALRLPVYDAYPLYFKNYCDLDYDQLKRILGNFFTLVEYDNQNTRATYRTEEDLRASYKALKKDKRYEVRVKLDVENGFSQINNGFNRNRSNNFQKTTHHKLISRWLNKDDSVVIDIAKKNCFPIQIYNYKHFKYDDLVDLFSEFGEFWAVVHLENQNVQVNFSSEDGARECYKGLSKDLAYKIRLLFFLKELNPKKKLVKEIAHHKEDEHIAGLIAAEEKIKFAPPSAAKTSNLHTEKRKPRLCEMGGRDNKENPSEHQIKSVYHLRNKEDSNVYVRGVPLHNQYLTPQYSYLVWRNKRDNLPPPPPPSADVEDEKEDFNYKYYVETLKPCEDSGEYSSSETDRNSSSCSSRHEHLSTDSQDNNESSCRNQLNQTKKRFSWKFDESFSRLRMT